MKKTYRNLVFAAMCLALAVVLPSLLGGIPDINQIISPMHIPALLCGFICGPIWGLIVGFIAPLLGHLIFHTPYSMIIALPMAFELAAYGVSAGVFYRLLPKRIPYIYVSLVSSMIIGRIVSCIVKFLMSIAQKNDFVLSVFFADTVIKTFPGIILHIILIPLIVMALRRAKVLSEQ